jgi:hypothetical protein
MATPQGTRRRCSRCSQATLCRGVSRRAARRSRLGMGLRAYGASVAASVTLTRPEPSLVTSEPTARTEAAPRAPGSVPQLGLQSAAHLSGSTVKQQCC